eukprot:CFRG0809T1
MKVLTSCVCLAVAICGIARAESDSDCVPECSTIEFLVWIPADGECPESEATHTFTAVPNGACAEFTDASSDMSAIITYNCENQHYGGEVYTNANCSGTPLFYIDDYNYNQCTTFGSSDNATVRDGDDDDDEDRDGDDDADEDRDEDE